jgi:hypothetical protein
MEGSPFRVRGIETADCRGRTITLQRVHNELVNNQVSIVGSRHSGKTVLMHRLAAKIEKGGGQFAGSLLWNLKEEHFTSDGDFLDGFRNRLVEPVRRIDDGLVKDLQTDGWSSLEAVQTVFEWLHNSGKCLVVCMDGFDALPVGTILTAGLLENLRSLAVKCTKSIRFVITSRKPLRDLCASLETADSPFHNLFPDPVVLQALTRQEVEEFVTPFRDAGVTVVRGADTEMFNWSGGFPLLVSMLGQKLWTRLNPGDSLTPEIVNEVGAEVMNDSSGFLQDLWDDCTPEQKEILTRVASGRVDDFAGPSSARHVRALLERGYVARAGNRVQFQCRTMQRLAEGKLGAQSELMTNLFGTAERFSHNVRVLLQYRLANRALIDEHLLRVTEKIIDTFDDPNTSVALFREAARQLFILVWRRLFPQRTIPRAWTEYWQNLLDERKGRVIAFNAIPADGSQCRLLDQLTGQYRPKDICIRRSTYVLLNALWGIGDYGQHRETEEIQPGFLICSCFTLLEAWAQLEVDLRRT